MTCKKIGGYLKETREYLGDIYPIGKIYKKNWYRTCNSKHWLVSEERIRQFEKSKLSDLLLGENSFPRKKSAK